MSEKHPDKFDLGQADAHAGKANPLRGDADPLAAAAGSRWLTPGVMAAGIAAAVGLVVPNFAAALYGDELPWLPAADLVADLAVIATGVLGIVRVAMQAEARTARMHSALTASQTRLAAIVESAMDAIITVDEEQRIVLFNRAAERVFRCRREDMLGQPLDRLLPMRFRHGHGAHIRSFGTTGETSRRMGDATTLWALRADGSEEFPIEASISHASEGGRRFYTVILRDITLRKERDLALERQRAELRELSAQVHEAREEEKTRIARELHDELGQLLTALKMDLSWLNEKLMALAPGSAANVAAGERTLRMGETLDRLVHSVRRISADLRPLMLDDLGLEEAAGWLVDEFAGHSGLEVSFERRGGRDLSDLDKKVASTLYRALQESLTNIGRHAGASQAWVVLAADETAVRLEVEDNGRGIEGADLAKIKSLGLKGMRERVSFAGGELEISRAPRGGTRVHISVPLQPADATGQGNA